MNTMVEHINSAGFSFVEFTLPMLVQSGLLIVVLLLADFLLRKKVKAVFRYWIWMLVLVKLVLPTSLSSPLSLGSLFGDKLTYQDLARTTSALESAKSAPSDVSPLMDSLYIQPNAFIQPMVPVIPGVEQVAAGPVSPPAVLATPVTWQGVVFLVWLAVVIAMALLLLQRALFVRGLVTQAKEANRLMNDTLSYCCERMGVKGKVGLKVSANATSPAVCGLIRPVILLPRNLAPGLGASHLRAVLLHELAHIKRGDLWVNLAQTALQIIYFYNPLLWLANCVIRRVREQAVDEAVLVAMGAKAQQYPQTLVDVARLAFKRPALSLRLIGVVESESALAGRIKHILGRPIPKSTKLGILGALAIIIIGAVLLPMAKATGDKTPTYPIDFEITKSGFLKDDWIGITELLGTSKELKTGETFTVRGKYRLGSHDEAMLHVYATNGETSSEQGPVVKKGSGDFSRTFGYLEEGDLHLSFYPAGGGSGFGGIYFKQKESSIEEVSSVSKQVAEKAPFAAKLANGVTVELVGVCEFLKDGRNCWKPDGSKLDKAIYVSKGGVNKTTENLFGLIVRTDKPCDLEWIEIEGMVDRSNYVAVVDEDGQPVRDGMYYYGIKVWLANRGKTNIRMRVAPSKWNLKATYDGKYIIGKLDPKVRFFESYETANGVSIIFNHDYGNYDCRMVAKVSRESKGPWQYYNGKRLCFSTLKTVFSPDGSKKTAAIFEGLKLSDVEHFEFGIRYPYNSVQFKNVSLRPGMKPDVQVEVEEAGKASIGVIDVAVEDFKIRPYEAGGLYVVTVAIQNNSNVTAPAFRLNFYRGDPADNLNLHGKPQTGSHGAGPIKPGDVWNEGSMPFALKEGINEIAVVLDHDNKIAESDETNNRASMKVIVKDGRFVERTVSYSSQKNVES